MPIINQVVQGGGTTPTGTIPITTNGTHDVTNYASADVQVPTTAPAHYLEKTVDANGKLISGLTLINLTGVSDIGDTQLFYAYANKTNLTGVVDLSPLTKISGKNALDHAFYGCTGVTGVNMSNITEIVGEMACDGMFEGCTGITGTVDLGSLTKISNNSGNVCRKMFCNCTGITGFNLSDLTEISGSYSAQQMFLGNTNITSVGLGSLTKIAGYNGAQGMFNSCTGITSVDLSSLVTVWQYMACGGMFAGCAGLTNVELTSLTDMTAGYMQLVNMFYRCLNLASISFPSLTASSFGSNRDQFAGIIEGPVVGCTIHFPNNIQAKIETLSGYPNFGGTNTTVLFDLPATYTLTGADTETYTRNPKYDTATALAWKVGAYGTTNFTPAYYTSGTTDPAVGDTIYSDAACTTTVTTISAIA